MKLPLYISLLLMMVISFVISLAGYWYLSIAFAAILGYLSFPEKKWQDFLFGVCMFVGIFIYLAAFDLTYRLREADVFSGVAGIPGGFALPLILLFVFSLLFGFFGTMLGSSVHDERSPYKQ